MSFNGRSFHGHAIYEIMPNGCLCGAYNNNSAKTHGRQFVEIARKKDEVNNDLRNNPNAIFGDYVCCYITYDNRVVTCDLEIRRIENGEENEYKFRWSILGVQIKTFEGIGTRDENTIHITYTDAGLP